MIGRDRYWVASLVTWVVALGVYFLLNPLHVSPFALSSLVNQSTTLAFAAVAQTFVVLTGGIDLSVGPAISMINSLASNWLPSSGIGIILIALALVAIGCLAGALNGICVAFLDLPPIIVTLATGFVFSGIALFARPNPGGTVPEQLTSSLTGAAGGVVPSGLLLTIFLFLLLWLPVRESPLGRSIFAVGSNERGAFAAGLATRRAKFLAYVLAGGFLGVAGVFFTAYTATGDALSGNVYTLNSIAAVVLGGTALTGGRGGILGSILGAYVIAAILSMLFFLGVSPFYQSVVQGVLLLLAVAAASVRNLLRGAS